MAEVKISKDGGGTWEKAKVNFQNDISESGLEAGTMFQHQGKKYIVESEDGELVIREKKR